VKEEFNNPAKPKVAHCRVTDRWSDESVLHAWVEMDDIVFDWQTSHVKPLGIPHDIYYS
tara:strand:+ start:1148 stop:1324 length:177 start_codon:yes stop_codon:yes gene_type:complete